MRTLCIYVLHEYNLNVDFFIKNGIINDPNIDFYFVVNDLQLELIVPGATVVNRENKNFDFGGWFHILLTDNRYKNYDYFILLNSTVRGPFYPLWYKNKNWPELFINRITDDLKLLGISISAINGHPHIQSMLLITDRRGLEIGIQNEIFKINEPAFTKLQCIMNKEIKYSTVILNSGYNIGCMLKVKDGIDYRIQKKYDGGVLCEDEYYGTNVHPYETIVCKISTNMPRAGRNIKLVDLYTNWNAGPIKSSPQSFNWVQYLLNNPDLIDAGIVTNQQANRHYLNHGRLEGRAPQIILPRSRYYKIDLNPLLTNGLINQLYSLINGILIGHYVGRNILVTNFYPQYDKPNYLPIEDIIDMAHLNMSITKLGLSTYVSSVNMLDPLFRDKFNFCKKSKYYNPTKSVFINNGFLKTLLMLQSEYEIILDIGDTFSAQMFQENNDPPIIKIFKQLLVGIKFTDRFYKIVDHIKKSIGIDKGYKVVHLEIEDDKIGLHNNYRKKLALFLNQSDKFVIVTHLIKQHYTINEIKHEYPNLIMLNSSWRNQFKSFYEGRDIDTIIDYLISLGGTAFLGYNRSSFSKVIMYSYQKHHKPYFDINDDKEKLNYMLTSNLPFQIMFFRVCHGNLGLSGNLGYSENQVSTIDFPEKDVHIISAHAPSKLVIKFNVPLTIRGYCSPTAVIPPRLEFFCDQRSIGIVSQEKKTTAKVNIPTGIHKLTITSSTIEWAHSIWILSST